MESTTQAGNVHWQPRRPWLQKLCLHLAFSYQEILAGKGISTRPQDKFVKLAGNLPYVVLPMFNRSVDVFSHWSSGMMVYR